MRIIFLLIIFLSIILTGPHSYFIIPILFVIFVIIFNRHFNWSQLKFNRLDFIIWFFFFISLFLTSLFTQSISSTFEEMFHYIFVFFVYLIVLILPNEDKFFEKFLKQIIFLLIVVSLIFILNIFFKINSYYPSEINFIDYYFGHNHLAVLILLILPASWKLYYKEKKLKIIPFFLLFVLILSFGRVAIVLGVCQLIYIFFKKSKQNSLYNNKSNIILLISILMITLVSFISFQKFFNINICNSYEGYFKNPICKDIYSEYRIYYWKQAFNGFLSSPLVGTGLGTYHLTAIKFRESFSVTSVYAHSAYLRHLSETGIIGFTGYILLLFGLLFRGYKINKNNSYKVHLLLGLLTVYVSVLFDFDFSIKPIFIVIVVVLSLLNRSNIPNESKFMFKWLKKFIFFVLSMIIFIISIYYYINVFLISDPYIEKKINIYLFDSLKNIYFHNVDKEKLYIYYKNDSSYYLNYMNPLEDYNQKKKTREVVFKLDPLLIITLHDVDGALLNNDLDYYENESVVRLQKIISIESKSGYMLDNLRSDNALDQLYIANYYINQGEFEKALKSYELAINTYDLSVIGSSKSFINKLPNDKFCDFSKIVFDYNYNFLDEKDTYMNVFVKCLENISTFNDTDELNNIVDVLLLDNYLDPDLVHTYIYQDRYSDLRDLMINNQYQSASEYLKKYFKIRNHIKSTYEVNLSSDIDNKYVDLIIKVANRVSELDIKSTIELYQLAFSIKNSSLDNNNLWYEGKEISKLNHDSLIEYVLSYITDNSIQLVKKDKDVIVLANYAILFSNNYQDNLKILNYLITKYSNNYWLKTQLGNYLLSEGKFDEAEVAYQDCIDSYNLSFHVHCNFGLLKSQEQVKIDYFSPVLKVIETQNDNNIDSIFEKNNN